MVKRFKVMNNEIRVLRMFVKGFTSLQEIEYMSYNELFDIVAEIVKTHYKET